MADIKYTQMQKAAIELRDKNILVSAAAGSGKTAVLVKRIIDRILDDNDPVDVDRILVMTFTRAAAQQMKEKIIHAIDEKRFSDPQNLNIRKQYVLVHNASIMTIDSFCMNVVRNHFEEINLSPDFRMADEGEMRLLMQDVLEKLLEDKYEEGNEAFLKMTEAFSTGKTDTAIEKSIFDLYKYSQSYPYPDKWLDKCADEYGNDCWNSLSKECPDENSILDGAVIDSFNNIQWVRSYVNQVREKLTGIRRTLDECIDICNMQFGPKGYEKTLSLDLDIADTLLNAKTYTQLYDIIAGLGDDIFKSIGRVSVPKEGAAPIEEINKTKELKDHVYEARNACKDYMSRLIETVSVMSVKEVIAGMIMMSQCTRKLINVTKEFSELLKSEKQSKKIVDFSDLEHYCLEILKNGKDTTAKEYASFYREIYVDEYQDSNLLQEEILKCLTADIKDDDPGRLFMVGDNKQSIYGFRLARPQIFIDKYNNFADIDDKSAKRDIKIDLSDNFRSRIEVLDAVNGIFSKIMTKETGGIEYNDRVRLNLGAKYKDLGANNRTELMLAVKDGNIKAAEAEAYMTAAKIKELMNGFIVEEDGKERRLKYSDIVILMRSPKGRDTIFMNILEAAGIPVHITSSQGYFSAAEIVILLDYLKVIDNPLQDIPLAGAMMSVIGGFTEDELAIIKASHKDMCLYDACISYIGQDGADEGSLIEKLKGFIDRLNYYRRKSEYSSVEEILTEIIDSDYGIYVKAMKGGVKKYANLNMLINKAKEYGKTSFKGIFHFNRYIEALKKYDIDYGEANTLDENDDTVRIMSIHKSKGLEFPVCFVCGLNNKMNLSDSKSSFIIDSDYGVATDTFDADRRIKADSLFKLSVSEKKKLESIAEEMRLLYVAMTRAKEKLIMTAYVKSENELEGKAKDVTSAMYYLDFIKCALDKYGEAPGFIDITVNTASDLVAGKVTYEAQNAKLREKLICMVNECVSSKSDANDKAMPEYIEEIKKRMSFVYPFKDEGNAVKMSVSELKHLSDNTDVKDELLSDENTVPYSAGKASRGALHGSAVHRIFELWDYTRDESVDSVRDFLKYVENEKLMEDDLFDTLDVYEIAAFVQSDIAKRMKEAYKNGTLRREQPFVIALDENDPESMLIQGIIDAYFIEDDKIVLVDYKTDRNKTEQMLIEDHKTQLDYYAMALGRMLDLEIKDKIIYSTELKKAIPV